MARLDRNALGDLRQRRNAQRTRDGAIMDAINVSPPIGNDGTSLSLTLNAAGGLEVSGGGLQINLDGTTLALSASGLKINDDGVGSDQLGILTTKGDLIGFSTAPGRLPVGTNGQALLANSAATFGIEWGTVSYTPPVTTKGDIFTYSTLPDRLPVGTNGFVLKANSATATGLEWAAATSPLTTKGDLYVYTTTDARLPIGANFRVLTADSSLAAGMGWAAPFNASILADNFGLRVGLATNSGLTVVSGQGLSIQVNGTSLALGASGIQVNLATNSGLAVSSGLRLNLSAKGDIPTFGTANTVHALNPRNGLVLTVDTNQSTGIVWSEPAAGFRNKIINPFMRFAQRGTSFVSPATGTYTLDRWRWSNSSAAAVTITQSTDVPSSTDLNASHSLKVDVTTADASVAAGDLVLLTQIIEGYNLLPLKDRAITLTFWVKSNKTGSYAVSFRNAAGDRSNVTPYTISVANTWEQKRINITHSSTGSWFYDNLTGLRVDFTLMVGSTFQTANTTLWENGNFLGFNTTVNLMDNTANEWFLTGVQLELGSFPSVMEHRPPNVELSLCQRYYEKSYPVDTALGTSGPGALLGIAATALAASTAGDINIPVQLVFKEEKRAAPTVVVYDFDGTVNATRVTGGATNAKRSGCTVSGVLATGVFQTISFDNTSAQAIAQNDQLTSSWTADAELT